MNKNTIYKLYFVLEFYLGTLYFIGLFFFFREKNFLAIVASFVFDAKKDANSSVKLPDWTIVRFIMIQQGINIRLHV